MGRGLVTALTVALFACVSLNAHGHGGEVSGPVSALPTPLQAPAVAPRLQVLSAQAIALLPIDARHALQWASMAPQMPPVLLPEDSGLLRSAQVVLGPTWHAVSMAVRDYSVYIHASAKALSVPGVKRPPVRVPTLAVPRISRTHDIVTAHFVTGGVAFDVDIECLGGVAHPMCGDDALVRELLRSLGRLEARR